MSRTTLATVTRSEFAKFRTARSYVIGLIVLVVLFIGMGLLISGLQNVRVSYHHGGFSAREFDSTAFALIGYFFAQFAGGVIGALFVTSEFATGSIRTTLAAVPRRGLFVVAKAIVVTVLVAIASEIAAFVAFFSGTAIQPRSAFDVVANKVVDLPIASLSGHGVLRAVIMSGVYVTLLALLGVGLGLIVRHTAGTISIFVGLIFIVPLISLALPTGWQQGLDKVLPSNLGQSMISVSQPANSLSPGPAALLLAAYALGFVLIGYVLTRRRDV